jgi:hypothetical protein
LVRGRAAPDAVLRICAVEEGDPRPESGGSSGVDHIFLGLLAGGQDRSAKEQAPVGVTLTDNTTGATSTGTVTYQQPIPHGNGSCGDSTTSGQALITWGNNNHTVVGYNTTGALAAVELQGSVVSSMTLTLVPSSVPAGFSAPSTYTITTNEPSFPVGQSGLAALTFSPTTQD